MEKEVSQLVGFIKGMGVIATTSFFHPSSLPGFALTTLESKKLYSEHQSTFGFDICNQCMPWELGSLKFKINYRHLYFQKPKWVIRLN